MIETTQESFLSQSENIVTSANGTFSPTHILSQPSPHAMTYDVLLERTNAGYIARPLFWPQEVVMAATREAALEKARHVIRQHLSHSEIVSVSVEADTPMATQQTSEKAKHPLAKFSGMFAGDDPYWDTVQEEIERYRDELDRELGAGKYMEIDEDSIENLPNNNEVEIIKSFNYTYI